MEKIEGNPNNLVKMNEWRERREKEKNKKDLENASMSQILEWIDDGSVSYKDVEDYASNITEGELKLIEKFETYRRAYHSKPARETRVRGVREVTIDIEQ